MRASKARGMKEWATYAIRCGRGNVAKGMRAAYEQHENRAAHEDAC